MPARNLILRLVCCASVSLALVAADGLAADAKTARTELSAAQIVDKHVAARGGLTAWRALQALTFSGKMEAGSGSHDLDRVLAANGQVGRRDKRPTTAGKNGETPAQEQVQLPFTLDMKRPGKSRVEIQFAGKTAVQVYDGAQGWKFRPYLNHNDVEPFTADEAKAEAGKAELEGPLVDYVAKGTKIELAGVEPVEGHDAYKLKLTMKNGRVQHIWIDAQSFLDVKVEGVPRRMDGKTREVWVYQRDFRQVQGLMLPFVLETAVDGYPQTHKMIIEKIGVNPTLDDARFAKPRV
jgi:hypothetical protein